MTRCLSAISRHGLVLALLALFSVLYVSTLNNDNMFIWDEAEYASIGKSILTGEGFSIGGEPNALRPPVLPFSASLSMLIFQGDDDAFLRAVIVIYALLALVFVYVGVAQALDRNNALVSIVVLGLQPLFWRQISLFMSEIPFLAFFTGALLFLYLGAYRNSRFYYLSWACLGLAMLTRYTALLYAPMATLFVVGALLADRKFVWPRIWNRDFFVSPLVGLLIVLPWLVRQQLTFGDPLIGFKIASGQLQAYLPNTSKPLDFYLQYLPEMLSWPGVALFLIGIVWTLVTRNRFALYCLMNVLFIFLWFSFYRYKSMRLVFAFLPFAAILTAYGLTRLFSWASVLNRLKYPMVPVCVVLAGLAVHSYVVTTLHLRQISALGYPSFKHAMEFLERNTDTTSVIMGASGPQMFWYTGRKTISFPERDKLESRLPETDWVVVTNFERSQKDYARHLLRLTDRRDIQHGNVAAFSGPKFLTVLIRSRLLIDRLGRK